MPGSFCNASVMDFQGTLFLLLFDLKLLATVQTDFSDACDVRKPSSDRSTTVLEGVVPCIRFASCSSEAVCSIGSISGDFSIPFGAFLFIYLSIYMYIYNFHRNRLKKNRQIDHCISVFLPPPILLFSPNAFWHARAKRHQGQQAGRRRLPRFGLLMLGAEVCSWIQEYGHAVDPPSSL